MDTQVDSSSSVARPEGPRGLVRRHRGGPTPLFSICTMVVDWAEYEQCLGSFEANGFTEATCEFLFIDNSAGNTADAYVAMNEFLRTARAGRLILCHHDIELVASGADELVARLAELDRLDPAWAICGNAGHTAEGWPVLKISDPAGDHDTGGPFPVRVMSLDENFLVVRREANLAASRDLTGFHHYATDLCLVADVLGWSCWVIDFPLLHKSGGKVNDSYFRSSQAMASKYARAFRPRWVYNIIRVPFFISGYRRHATLARWQRRFAKALGLAPSNRDLDRGRRP